LNRRS